MARRFGRNFDNPERRFDSVENSAVDTTMHSIESDYEDDFDKKLDALEEKNSDLGNRIKKQTNSAEKTANAKRNTFLQEIKVEETQENTPLMVAYRELDEARKSGNREDIMKAEDKILDLERQEQEREYTARIVELKKMQQKARESGNL